MRSCMSKNLCSLCRLEVVGLSSEVVVDKGRTMGGGENEKKKRDRKRTRKYNFLKSKKKSKLYF